MGYSCKVENEADFAKARVEDVNASYKDLAEVCGNIRRRPADAAVLILEEAKAGKRPLRYRSHNTRMAHRKELMGQKGRWPMKAAGIVLKCLQSAIANAKEKGLSEELIVAYACANKKNSHMRYSSKGRRNTSKLETARVEVVLREKVEEKKKRIEVEKKKKVEEAKQPKKEEAPKPAAEKKAAGEGAKDLKPAPEKPIKKAEAAKQPPAAKKAGAESGVESIAKPIAKAPAGKKADEANPGKAQGAKPEEKAGNDDSQKKEVA